MFKKCLVNAVLIGAFFATGSALAEKPSHITSDETGSVYHGTEYRKVGERWQRVDTWNNFTSPGTSFERAYRLGDVSADGQYVYVGDAEGTWQLRPHRYDFRGGRLTHADPFTHTAAAANANLSPEDTRNMSAPID